MRKTLPGGSRGEQSRSYFAGTIRTGVKADELEGGDPYKFPNPSSTGYVAPYARSALPALEGAGLVDVRSNPDVREEDTMYLSGLYVYPIKSAGGISLEASEVDGRGLRHDRRWMLIDESGRFMSQRRFPRMALIGVRIEPHGLVVDAPGMPSLEIPFRPPDGKLLLARVWDDFVESLTVSDDSDRWFSEFLGVSCKLVYLPDESVRPVDPTYGNAEDQVGLADGFPFLLISEASLADLNARLEHPLPMNRFRPNLVVRGCGAFAEDGWRLVRIGQITFRVVKPCARCAITTVDQESAVIGKEPLRTLARFRKLGTKVLFGQNLIHDGTGILRVGDPVQTLRPR